MDIKEFLSDDPQTKAWITTAGTKIACRKIPPQYQEGNFHLEAKFEVGTRDERPARFGGQDREGISHTGEHTPYLGTESYPGSWAIPRLIEKNKGAFNATTGRDTTNYWLHVPKEHALLAAQVIGELIRNPSPDPVVLERELGIIDTERATAAELSKDLDQILCHTFGDNPFGYPVIGTTESIRATTFEDIVRYREVNYRSGRLAYTIEADMEHERMLEFALASLEVAQKGGQISDGTRQMQAGPSYNGTVIFDERNKAESTAQIIGFARPEPGEGQFIDMKYRVLWGLFHAGADSSSTHELRVERGLHYGHKSDIVESKDSGLCFVMYETLPQNASAVRSLFAEELKNFTKKSKFYREKLKLITELTDYHIRDQHRIDPFYGTTSLTDYLLFENGVLHREAPLEYIATLNFDDMVESLDKLTANPPTIKLRGAVNDQPDYHQICEMFYRPSSAARKDLSGLEKKTAG